MRARAVPHVPVRPRRTRAGFTILELMVVLVIGMTLTGFALVSFNRSGTTTRARRAAQVFSRDLALARSMAVRGREKVTVKFYETSKYYEVTTASGRTLVKRTFSVTGDFQLSSVNLATTGDSIVFSNRGVATLSTSLGTADFTVGAKTYQVSFNSIGASKVVEL
jgi:Tfp pilus assembly protein FimT